MNSNKKPLQPLFDNCYNARGFVLVGIVITRSSADADKPALDAFRGQSRSPNMVLC